MKPVVYVVRLSPDLLTNGHNTMLIESNTSLAVNINVSLAATELLIRRYDKTSDKWSSDSCRVSCETRARYLLNLILIGLVSSWSCD